MTWLDFHNTVIALQIATIFVLFFPFVLRYFKGRGSKNGKE